MSSGITPSASGIYAASGILPGALWTTAISASGVYAASGNLPSIGAISLSSSASGAYLTNSASGFSNPILSTLSIVSTAIAATGLYPGNYFTFTISSSSLYSTTASGYPGY